MAHFLLPALGLLAVPALAQDATKTAAPAQRVEVLERSSGQRTTGKLIGDASAGFQFTPEDGGAPMALEPGTVLSFEGPEPSPLAALPPFHVLLGLDQRLSGRLGSLGEPEIRLAGVPGSGSVTIARGGAQALVQRPGEALVLSEGFESLDEARWSVVGDPEVVAEPHLAGARSLRLPAGGTAVTYHLVEPIGSGRFELAYHDSGTKAPGQRWFVDLTFRGASGPEPVRAILGWEEASLAVESLQGPTLAVQRLARGPGWHRLVVRFGPGGTALAVDGDDLAHGGGPTGPLSEIRLGTHSAPGGGPDPPAGLAAHVDDLTLARLAEPSGDLEIDPTQDELRLVGGDQLYGRVLSADAERVTVRVVNKETKLSWNEVAGVYFRRVPAQGQPVDGLLVRAEWRAAPGNDPHDVDRLEGALKAASADALTLATPYAGDVAIPRDRLRRLQVLGKGRRIVLDPTAHHLGDEVFNREIKLDPPQPESTPLDIPFQLDAVPPGEATISMDVLQVAGEEGNASFSAKIKRGELRTYVWLNGTKVDYLNRHIASKNETPERITLAVPAGLLKSGRNILRIEQTGEARNHDSLDDLGVLTIALEFPADRPQPRKPGP